MGLDSILMHSAAAGAMAAQAPTSAVIKAGNTPAFLVGAVYCGVTAERMTITCADDPDWPTEGIIIAPSGNGGVQDAPNLNPWLPYKVPIKRGATIACTSVGAGDHHAILYIEYPDIGQPFAIRQPVEGPSLMTSFTITCGGALTALTARYKDDTNTSFKQDVVYMPVKITPVTGGTGPEIIVGFEDISEPLYWLQFIPLTEVLMSGVWQTLIPHGYTPIIGKATQYIIFWSETTDTPAVQIDYALIKSR